MEKAKAYRKIGGLEMSYGDIDLESAVEKAWREKTMPQKLWDAVDDKIENQKGYIESDSEPDWNEGDLSYELAFDDAWDGALSWEDKPLVKQIKDWLIEIGYYISHPHPKWVEFNRMGSNPQIRGTEFRYKNKVWQTLQYDSWRMK
jgi:hypothetical protein